MAGVARGVVLGHGGHRGGHRWVAGDAAVRKGVAGVRGRLCGDGGVELGGSRGPARWGLALACTDLGQELCVRKLEEQGVKRAHWSNAGSTGAWGASFMAASCLCSHGGSRPEAREDAWIGANERRAYPDREEVLGEAGECLTGTNLKMSSSAAGDDSLKLASPK